MAVYDISKFQKASEQLKKLSVAETDEITRLEYQVSAAAFDFLKKKHNPKTGRYELTSFDAKTKKPVYDPKKGTSVIDAMLDPILTYAFPQIKPEFKKNLLTKRRDFLKNHLASWHNIDVEGLEGLVKEDQTFTARHLPKYVGSVVQGVQKTYLTEAVQKQGASLSTTQDKIAFHQYLGELLNAYPADVSPFTKPLADKGIEFGDLADPENDLKVWQVVAPHIPKSLKQESKMRLKRAA